MRVLVVDQDSASNEAIARSLRELFTVDAVTNKGDCLDLLRSNTFEVIVATERLDDGSGLELLGHVGKKWPSMLRIFAADRERLKLLRGRLGPFQLFQTLAYPIAADRLIATLNLAEAAQNADADTSAIQHVELTGDFSDLQTGEEVEESEHSEEPADTEASEESGQFPSPEPLPRAASADSHGGSLGRSGHRGAPQYQARSRGAATSRHGGAGGSTAPRVAPGPSASRSASGSSSRSSGGVTPMRHRPRGSGYKSPVRPSIPQRSPPLERDPPLEPPQTDSFAEAAEMARAARNSFEPSSGEIDTKRLAIMIGGGVAAIVVLVVLGFKLFGSKSEPPHPAPTPVVHAPQYPPLVLDLVAKIETSLQADDFKAARPTVEQLRALAPSHPRLAFFEGLLAQHADAGTKGGASKGDRGKRRRSGNAGDAGANGVAGATTVAGGNSAGRGDNSAPGGGKNSAGGNPATGAGGNPAVGAGGVLDAAGNPAIGAGGKGSGSLSASAAGASAGGGSAGTVAVGSATPDSNGSAPASSSDGPSFAPETPPGITRHSPPAGAAASASTPSSNASPPEHSSGESNISSAPAQASSSTAASSGTPTSTSSSASASAPSSAGSTNSSSNRRASSDEPPPVIREAKLIRRVEPDYPSAAKRDGVIGFVDLDLTIAPSGAVTDVTVVHATPADMFEKSALAAVHKWKYDPRFVDGLPSEAHLAVHLDFRPDK